MIKIMNTKNINLLGLVLLFSCFLLSFSGNQHEISKTVVEEFNLDANDKLQLSNKYGNINISTWDKQRTKIDVLITVKAQSEKRTREIIDNVNIEFTEGRDFVKAETIFGDEGNSFWSWGSYNVSYEINYNVFMPANAYLEVENKYGDVEIPVLERKVDAWIKYGDIHMAKQESDLNLDLKYGNALLDGVGNLSCEIKYSEMDLKMAKDVSMDSKYSKFKIGTIGNLSVTSGYDHYEIVQMQKLTNEGKYDEFRIGMVQDIIIESKYTNISIDELDYSAVINQRYGRVNIGKIGAKANNIVLNTEYMDFTVDNMSSGFEFELNGEYSGFSVPDNSEIYEKDKDHNSLYMKGKSGNGQASIAAEMRYGNLKIRN